MRSKSTDVNNIFKPVEEIIANPPEKLQNKRRDASIKPVIKVVPVKSTPNETYIGEKIDLNEKRKGYWAKLDKDTLDTALKQLGIPKELLVNIKGQFVKKEVDKINKKTMLGMIYKKLNILGSKIYNMNIKKN